jgi:hypothetical protein
MMHADNAYHQFLQDDFLRRFILRYILFRSVLRIHREFGDNKVCD